MATSASGGSSGGAGGGSAGKAAGLATPEASGSSEALEDDQPPHGSEGKRKKFHPLRAVRKIFRWKAKRQGTQEVVGPSKKSRSTGELQSVPDEDQRLKGPVVPYSIGLSVSHDSVFSPDTSMAMADSDGLHQGSSLSVNRTSHKLVFKDELFTRVQARRDSDDDDIGLPHSPCTSPTTADVLSRGLEAKASKPQSTCSAGSLSSMFSSENDEDAAVQASQDSRTEAAEADVSGGVPLPLNHNAALHKIAVKPKRTHALPRHRMLQALSAASPRLLPTTPELSEDSNKALSTHPVEPSEAMAEVAGEDDAVPTTSQARNPPSAPKPLLKDEKDDETTVETPRLVQEAVDAAEDVKDDVPCEKGDSHGENKNTENVEPPSTLSSANSKLHEPLSSDPVTVAEGATNESAQAAPSRITISNNEVTVSGDSHLIKENSEVTILSARDEAQAPRHAHHSPKPKAAELKLRHEIAQFNKRQREMGKTLDYCDTDEATAEMIDIQESIRTLDLAIESGESKDDNEYFEEQNHLDLVNGNVQFSGERYNRCVGESFDASEKASHAGESQVAASETAESALVEPPHVGPRKLSQPQVAARESLVPMPRRISSVEIVQGASASVSSLQRPLSVEILPFSQRRKEQNYPPSPTKADAESKLEDTRRSTPQLNSSNDVGCDPSSDAGGAEKNHMSYPIHFRIYKGRRSSLVTEENGSSIPSSQSKGPALNGQPTTVTSPLFEVKIQSMSEKESKPEVAPRAIFLENGERVELRNHHGQQLAKERSKSASDMTGSPPRRDDLRPRPFTRSILPKNSEASGEPELFKVFARRSLKQKTVEKRVESDANDSVAETTFVKPDIKPEMQNGHGVPGRGSGGTIIQISELGTTVDSPASNKLHRARHSGSVSSLIETSEKSSTFGNGDVALKGPPKQGDVNPIPQVRESLGRSSALQSGDGSSRLPALKSSEFLVKSVTVVNSESSFKPVAVTNGSSPMHTPPSKSPESPGRKANSAAPPPFHAAKPVGFKQDGHSGIVLQRNGDLGPPSKSVTIVAPEASSGMQHGEATGALEMHSPARRNLHASRPRFHTSPEVAQEEIAKVTGIQKKPHTPFEKTSSVSSESSSSSSLEGGSSKSGKALQRASSVSSASPSSTGSFRASKMATMGAASSTPGTKLAEEQQPSWLQLAQQRRELREQRERLMLGRPPDSSFVLDTSSKPSRSSKVLDMVSNFQKLQMT